MPYFFVWQIKIFSTVAWQNVRAANRTKNFEKGQQKRKSLRKKKNFGDLWKNIFRIVTQPREQSQTSTSRTNAWREAFGKCSMPNRNPSQHTHSPKARAGGHDIVKFTGKPFWRRTFVKKKPFRVVGSFFVV